MLVVRVTVSNFNNWKQLFFYVRLNAASVAEEFIPMFRMVPNPLPYISVVHPWPMNIMEVRDAMRSGDHWWTSFTGQRVRKAIRLVHSDFEAEGEIDFAPVEHLPERVPDERSPELPQKNKDIEVEDQDFPTDDSPLPGWDPSLGFGDESGSSDAQIPNFDDFFSGLPDHPNPFSFVEETEERPEVLAETSRVVKGVSFYFFLHSLCLSDRIFIFVKNKNYIFEFRRR
ncbi:hypothetical protein Rs2_29148 [Raphanus sativus]|nr:hypothetical protein Rs2_29148 [Raphanus sativus]